MLLELDMRGNQQILYLKDYINLMENIIKDLSKLSEISLSKEKSDHLKII